MFIESKLVLKIGEIVTIGSHEISNIEVKGKVLRSISEEEYIQDALADSTLEEHNKYLFVVTGRKDLFWYEVAVD